LTTILTTTTPDSLPFEPISQIEHRQVSHGIRQPARFLLASGRLGSACPILSGLDEAVRATVDAVRPAEQHT
jgi:hypothetical protein